MTIDRELVLRIAHLARIQLDDEEIKEVTKDMEKITTWVDKLNELDTKDIEPLTQMSHEKNIVREDRVEEVLPIERVLKNAPNRDSDYFKVPKVID